MSATPPRRDYSLLGRDAQRAVENGLATAEWYRTEIPRKTMKELMRRSDGPGIRDTLIWFALLIGFGSAGALLCGSWWSVPFFFAYGAIYGGSADSRWHESGHGTVFRTRWMNEALYQIASFMMMREPTVWRWSHTRHHTDTIIVGRDLEIAAMRPPDIVGILLSLIALKHVATTTPKLILHACGRLTAEEKIFIPKTEWGNVFMVARIWLVLHLIPLGVALVWRSWVPVLLVGPLPTMYGAWYSQFMGLHSTRASLTTCSIIDSTHGRFT
jgi:fatty acid desaturase